MATRGQGYFLFLWTKAHFADIALFSIAFSFLVAIGVYVKSFMGKKLLALGGNTGNPIYDVIHLDKKLEKSPLSNNVSLQIVYDWP